tara:strand:- start:43 stop:735 length:693 start_codon:yes stop_codon:yes gene_type:complete
MDKPWKLGNKLDKEWSKNKDIEWKYVKGKRTPFLNGKQLTVGTRHRDLLKAAGGDLSNAFRDILKIGRIGKNPEFDEYGRPLNILEAEYRKRGAYAKAKEQSPDVQPRTWSNAYGSKSDKPSSIEKIEKKEEIPSDKPFKNTVGGDGSVKKSSNTNETSGYEDEHPLSDPDYNPESTKKNRPIKRGAIEKENVKRFGEDVVDKLKIKHADWKKARKSGTLDKWRKKYGVK